MTLKPLAIVKLSFIRAGASMLQRVWITLQYFGGNGLANHAAAGAYGFLLSLMPALLIVAYFISVLFASSSQEAARIILGIGFLGGAFDIGGTVERFLDTFNPGLTGITSLISMLWAAIVFAFSMQRGLNSIFFSAKASNPIKSYLIPLGLEVTVIVFVFITVMGAHLSALLFGTEMEQGIVRTVFMVIPFLGLGLLTFGAYRIVPNGRPNGNSARAGAVLCIAIYAILSALFSVFINPERYHVIYGTLGDLILLLAKVYFFFMFFFIGAQFAFVVEYFDALLFIKLRMARSNPASFFIDKLLFSSIKNGRLQTYCRSYSANETIFSQGEDSHDIYYILSGSVHIYLNNKKSGRQERVAVINADTFFGEMGHLLANKRSATAKAADDLTALVLPPALFQQIMTIDKNADNKVIETLSERLKHTNEQLTR
ncbi:MAG: YihY/virulence factor BrkB family protein [Treponema sp.]|jgi:membrane protein|nr:YihY/virulence factor BrkB family protein [Treponema sp.]